MAALEKAALEKGEAYTSLSDPRGTIEAARLAECARRGMCPDCGAKTSRCGCG